MRIRLIIFFTFLLMSFTTSAQSDIQVMLKQIALLAVQVRELEKAIEIARDGLTTINEIKHGEFNLHNIFFSSLQSVNPAVAKYSRIAVIIADQISIIREFKALLQKQEADKQVTTAELLYVRSVYAHVTDECEKKLSDLVTVTTSGSLEMTDDERIKRIDVIAGDMNDRYAFSRHFTSGTGQLMTERESEDKEIKLLRSLE